MAKKHLTSEDISQAICDLALVEIPALAQINENLLPKGHKRPSLLVEYIADHTSDANRALVDKTFYYTLTVYEDVDEYSQSDIRRLLALQSQVADLFRKGFLQVKNRAIKATASTGGRNWDEAYIEVQFEFMDLRGEPTEHYPPMEEIHTDSQYNQT